LSQRFDAREDITELTALASPPAIKKDTGLGDKKATECAPHLVGGSRPDRKWVEEASGDREPGSKPATRERKPGESYIAGEARGSQQSPSASSMGSYVKREDTGTSVPDDGPYCQGLHVIKETAADGTNMIGRGE